MVKCSISRELSLVDTQMTLKFTSLIGVAYSIITKIDTKKDAKEFT